MPRGLFFIQNNMPYKEKKLKGLISITNFDSGVDMRKVLLSFILALSFFILPGVGFALDMGSSTICGKDLNNDGFFAEDELQECISGVCPIDTVNCDVQLSDPVCPGGGFLSIDRDMCQADSTNSCPSGYTYDQSIDRCVRAVECSDGGIFNPLTDRCEKLATDSCPDTYTLDAGNNICWKAVDCGTGGTFIAAKDRCERAISPACAVGFIFNTGNGKCEAEPSCSQGTYNATYNKCLKPLASKTCPSGYSYVSARDRCERTPVCASGTYNPATDKCESSATSTYAATLVGGLLYDLPIYNRSVPPYTFNYSGTTIFGYASSTSFPGAKTIYINPLLRFLSNDSAGGEIFGYAASTSFPGAKTTYYNNSYVGSYNYGQGIFGYVAPSPGTYGGTYTCNSSDTLSGTTCTHTTITQTSPTCPSGTMDYGIDVCNAVYTPTCDPGLTYDTTSSQCAIAATCAAPSVLDVATDKCATVPSSNCNTGWTLDAINNICYSVPTCLNGIFNTTTNLCNAAIVPNCGTYIFNATEQKCTQDVTCPNLQPGFSTAGTIAFSPELDICVSNTQHDCPTNYAYNGLPIAKCEAIIVCPSGTYDPVANKCQLGDYSCPLGNYSCSDINHNVIPVCSAFPCVNLATTPAEETPIDTTAYQNDGTVDPATGSCSGVFKIFNGHAGECMKAGWSTVFFNCCDTDQGSFLIFKEFCPEANLITVQAVIAQRTHYVGDYCKKKIPLIGCIQKAEVYCIFNSKLGRIIHEQGRPQLQKFSPGGRWGDAESSNCEGFTPEEFQTLDFSKIDLAEAFGDLSPASITNIQTNVNGAVGDYFNKIQ